MSARITRTRLFAATTVALAALALTACEGDGTDTGAPAPAASTASSTPADSTAPSADQNKPSTDGNGTAGDKGTGPTGGDTATDPNTDTGTSTSTGTGTGTGTEGNTDGEANDETTDETTGDDNDMPADCSAKDVKITAQTLSRPLNHLLLTATNTGSKTCMLPEYPAARFGEAQSVPPVAEASKPQSLTGVAPGEAGYAGVVLSAGDGSGENGYQAETLTIPFDDGSIATVALPSGGVYVDTALTVTYWQADTDLALGF